MLCQIRMPTVPMKAPSSAYSRMSAPLSSQTNRLIRAGMVSFRTRLRPARWNRFDRRVIASVPAVHDGADVGNEGNRDQRDEGGQQRVLDQVLAALVAKPSLHSSLHRRPRKN